MERARSPLKCSADGGRKRALTDGEKILGNEHPQVAYYLQCLSRFYRQQGSYDQAEAFVLLALAICEKVLGYEHPNTEKSVRGLAYIYMLQGRYETAKPLLRRSLEISEKAFGLDSMNVAELLESYAFVLRATKQNKAAAELETRAKLIRDKHAQENGVERDNEADARLDLMNNDRELFYHKFETYQ